MSRELCGACDMPIDDNSGVCECPEIDLARHHAAAAFISAKASARYYARVSETWGAKYADKTTLMRNAWVAYHAGAAWMTGTSQGVAEAYAEECVRLGSDVERLRIAMDTAAHKANVTTMRAVLLRALTRGDGEES